MKKIVFFLCIFAAAAFPVFSQDSNNGLSQEEEAFVKSCSENITLKVYSPRKASECLERLDKNDQGIIDRLEKDNDIMASRLLAHLNSLKDMGEFFSNVTDENLRGGLLTRLEAFPCSLCALNLGPQPEKLYPWVSKYTPKRLKAVKKAAYDWNTMARWERDYLVSVKKQSPEAWIELTISQREDIWKMDISTANSAASAAKMNSMSGQYAAAGAKLKTASGSPNGAAGFLNKTFDNSVAGTGDVQLAGNPGKSGVSASGTYSLTDAQAEKLAPRLLQAYTGPGGELSDTQVGREALAFMQTPGGKIKFTIANLKEGNKGAFNPDEGIVKINKAYIEEAMKKSKVSAQELMDESNTKSLNKIARYTAPTFVHEYAGHQMQTDWARKNGISNFYYLDHETDAFSKSSLFVLQKQKAELRKGNLKYTAQISESQLALARKFKKTGPAGVEKDIMYYEVPSRSGKAAENFMNYEYLKKELALRQLAKRENPEAESEKDAQRKSWNKTASLELEYKSVFRWYQLSLKKSSEDHKYYQEALTALDRRAY